MKMKFIVSKPHRSGLLLASLFTHKQNNNMYFMKQILFNNYSFCLSNLSNVNRLLYGPCISLPRSHLTVTQRYKSKRNKTVKKESFEDDVPNNDENEVAGKGTEIKTNVVSSMRTDLVLKMGLGVSRNKIEQAFYESRIRVNSKKIGKKSAQVHVGDEVDMIKGVSPANPDFLVVGRVELLDAVGNDDNEGITIKIRRSKALIVENYPDGDPWKHTDSNVS